HMVLTAIDRIPRDGMWLGSLAVAAQACVESGAAAAAAHLRELLAPYAGEWAAFGWAATWGPVAMWLGELASLLGRYEEAAEWRAPIAAAGAPGWALRVRYARARTAAEPDRVALGAVAREAKALGLRHLCAQATGARAAVAPPA
ncbi:MAG TPA: hypothetical protein VGW10_17970, partial [Solirubrobacteraceae bacterium]|nr:hypothetical protein [Solirubrobacteraceae bacterium]